MGAAPGPSARTVVVKVGTSSITDEQGYIVDAAIRKLCSEVAELRAQGEHVVIVTSGAIAAGLRVLDLHPRPTDPAVLQAVSAVGQSRPRCAALGLRSVGRVIRKTAAVAC